MRVLQTSDLRCPTTGKHAYPDEASARAQLRVVAKRPTPGRHPHERAWRCYCCPDCGWWHLAGGISPGKGVAPDGF